MIAILFGVFAFVAIFFVQSLREERKGRLRIKLEKLKSRKSEQESWLKSLGYAKTRDKLTGRFEAAGVARDPDEAFLWFLLVNAVIMALLIASGFVLLAAVTPVILRAVAFRVLDALALRRQRALEAQFRQFLLSLALHLKVTPSFQAALVKAAAETEKPLSVYVERAVRGVKGGESTEDAISTLKAIPSVYVRTWVDCVVFAVRIKGDLSALCVRTAKRLTAKLKMADKVAAQATQSKALMVALGGMLLFLVVTTMATSPEFVKFYTSPLGMAVASAAVLTIVFATLYVFEKIDKEMSG